MKVFDLFTKLFSVFAFLTIGSLLIMVALHMVAWEDMINDLEKIYGNPQVAFNAFLIGVFFIFMGLAFAKIIIKQTRYAGGLIYTGPMGRTTVSISAIEDVVRKATRRYPEILTFKLKCRGYEKKVEVKLGLIVHSGVVVADFTEELKKEILTRLERALGLSNEVEVFINIRNIKEDSSTEVINKARKAS